MYMVFWCILPTAIDVYTTPKITQWWVVKSILDVHQVHLNLPETLELPGFCLISLATSEFLTEVLFMSDCSWDIPAYCFDASCHLPRSLLPPPVTWRIRWAVQSSNLSWKYLKHVSQSRAQSWHISTSAAMLQYCIKQRHVNRPCLS